MQKSRSFSFQRAHCRLAVPGDTAIILNSSVTAVQPTVKTLMAISCQGGSKWLQRMRQSRDIRRIRRKLGLSQMGCRKATAEPHTSTFLCRPLKGALVVSPCLPHACAWGAHSHRASGAGALCHLADSITLSVPQGRWPAKAHENTRRGPVFRP
jgi:hypothetical protein